MSPEQYVSSHAATVESDVYSFGVMLYEMATGHLPFTSTSFGEWRNKHIHEKAASPSSCANISEALSAIIMKCLEKNAAQHFRDFAQLRASLESYCYSTGRSSLIPALVPVRELEAKLTALNWLFRPCA
jgi:eukaryotic-like serine/threonine-protein kinase